LRVAERIVQRSRPVTSSRFQNTVRESLIADRPVEQLVQLGLIASASLR